MMVPFPFVIILMVQLSGKGKPMITYKIDQNILVSVDLIGVREFTELGVLTTKLLLTLSNVKIMAQPYDSAIVIILVLVASAGRLTDSQNILTAFRPSTTTPRSSVISTVQNTVGNSLQSLPFSLQSIVTPLAQTLGLVTPPPAPIPWYAQVIERIQQFARYPLTILRNGTLVQLVPTHIGTIPNVLHPAIILQMMDSIAPTTTTRRPSILGTLGVGRRTTQPPSNDLLYDNSAVLTTKRPHQLKPQSRPHPAHTSEDMITIRSLLNAHKKIPLVTETTSNTSNSSNSGEQSTVLLIAEMDAADEPSNGIALPGLDNTAVRKKLNSEQLE